MKRISWKAINAWIMFGLLLAPGLYLFGGYIGQLAGSHGEFMYAEPAIEGGVDYSVVYEGNTYQRHFYSPWYANDLKQNKTEILFGFHDDENTNIYANNLNWASSTNIIQNADEVETYFQWLEDEENLGNYEIYDTFITTNVNFAFNCWYYADFELWYYEFFYDVNYGDFYEHYYYWTGSEQSDWNLEEEEETMGFIERLTEGGSLASSYDLLNLGFQWSAPATNTRYIPETQPSIETAQAIEPNAQGNTEFQQGQFFSRNNFLKKWGDSVVSQNETWGFAPFKALIQYLDDNMLHFAPNGVQYGLMAYGYMYYALHIVLLDLVFYITSFLPRILKKLAERLEGGLD